MTGQPPIATGASMASRSRVATRVDATALGRAALWLACALAVARATPLYAHLGAPASPARTLAAIVATVAATLGTLACVEYRARVDAAEPITDWFALGAAALAALGALDTFAAGGSAATWCALALVLALADRPTPQRLALAAGTVVALGAFDLDGLYGVVVLGLAALGGRIDARAGASRATFVAFLATSAGTAVAFALAHRSFAQLGAALLDPSADGTLATLPADVAPLGYRFGFAATLVGLVTIGLRPVRARDALLVVAAVALALRDGAAVPLVGLVAAPPLARAAREIFAATRGGTRAFGAARLRPFASAATALVVLLAVPLASRAWPDLPGEAAPYVRIVDALAADGRPHRLVCSRALWCGYAAGRPRLQVLVDDRRGTYAAAALRAQHAIAHVRPSWPRELARNGITDVLAGRTSALATLLAGAPEWRRTGEAGSIAHFARRAP